MDVIVLGAGTAIPSSGYSPAAILLRSGGEEALLDCGPGALIKAAQQGLDYFQLQTIFLTHLHSDHTLDLVTLIQANESTPGVNNRKPLGIFSCSGTREWFEKLMIAFPDISPSYSFSIFENGLNAWDWADLHVSTYLTGHTKNSLAYRFDGKDGSFVFTGDAIFSEGLVRFCARADLLISECSFPEGQHNPEHLSADQVGNLAEKASVHHLAITHQYPAAHAVDLAKQIGRQYSGKLTLAMDGTSFSLPEGR